MDMGDQEKYELENKNEDPMNYSAGLSSDWRFGGSNVKNTSLGLVQDTNSMAISKGDLIASSSCSSASMVDSFGAAIWNNYHTNSQNLAFCDNNAGSIANQLNLLGIAKGDLGSLRNGIDRTLDMCWNQPNSMLKGGYYLPNVPVMLPQSLSRLPTDSAFIERAARFSCFGSGNFTDTVNNSFPIFESVINPYSRGGGMMLGTQDVLAGNEYKSVSGIQSSKREIIVGEASKNVSMNVENGAIEGSPLKSSKRSESLGKSHDEVKGVGGSGNESDEAEFSGAGPEEPSGIEGLGGKSSAKGLASKKRKRNTEEDNDIDGVSQPLGTSSKDNSEIQQKVDQNPSTTINKTSGKNSKQGSQTSDPSKQEYIHVRARRGQATNSHSLAERVRREKISERMKFLQDLVPGCNKVTGKAVMLDEIINYVQSLQRQVEFLSMKLATVNPRLDFNLEGLLGKDILHPRAGPSHTPAFSPDMSMAYPMLHPSQGLIQAGVPGVGISPDILRRPIGSQLTPMPGGFKEPTQLPNVWDDELNNVIQMSYGSGTSNAPPNNQDVDGHMKAEL